MKFILMAVIIGALQAGVGGVFAAEQVTPLTLKQAWRIALNNHPLIQSSELMTRAAGQDVEIARSDYYPQIWGNAVGAVASAGTRIAAPDGINNPSVIGRGSMGISLTQLITDFGRTHYQVQAAKAREDAEAAKTEDTRETVLLDVTRSYYDTLRAQALLRVAEATLTARNDFLEQIKVMHDVGRRSDLDLSIARQEAAEAELLRTQAQSGVDDAFAVLSQSLGYGSKRQFALQAATMAPLPSGFDGLARHALDQNPRLRELRAEITAARRTYEAERAINYPTVSAVGYAGLTPIRDPARINGNYSAAGVVLNVPVFTGGRLSAAGQKAKLDESALERDLQAEENDISRDMRVAWNGTNTAYKSIDTTKEMLDSANKALDLTTAGFQLGRNSIVDLSQAKLNQIRAKIANVNAMYDYLIQRAILEYKIGDLSSS